MHNMINDKGEAEEILATGVLPQLMKIISLSHAFIVTASFHFLTSILIHSIITFNQIPHYGNILT